MLGTALSTSYKLTRLILTTTQRNKQCYSHFTNEKLKHRELSNLPKVTQLVEQGVEPKQS